ncbi:MAG: hypothetical protein PHQ98_03550 [Candidatus ainarchaeum sp.]|nr:hypothetical protein [Candidatus ainarchaeum sp.]
MENIQNKLKIYFFGGAQGVGKTTLLKKISAEKKIPLINTGSYFSNDESIEISKQRFVKDILSYSEKIIIDGHYVGFKYLNNSIEFEKGLSDDELNILINNSAIILILIDLNSFELTKRRKFDSKNRQKDIVNVSKELHLSRTYFYKYCNFTNQFGKVIYNYQFNAAFLEINDLINKN